MTKKYFVIICFLIIVSLYRYFTTVSLSFPLILQEVDARCPNGYHKSPTGDCERVTNTKGMPRCPNGYHLSSDGDCERVSKDISDSSNDKTPEKDYDSNNYDNNNYLRLGHNSINKYYSTNQKM